MAGLDIAAGYRPSVPVNKKRRTADYVGDTTGLAERFVGSGMNPGDFDEETGKVTTHAEADQYGREKDIYDAFYGHAGGEYVPGALQKAREGAARGGIIPGSSSNVRPSQPPMAPVAPRAGGTPPESTFNRGNGNWSSDYLAKKFADTDVESSMYRDAALREPEETAAFRDRRSARDRAAGLNVGRRPSGEVLNPMMPGAAGMGTGPSNTNYGGQGDKTNWYIDMANFKHDPNTAERTQGLLEQTGMPNNSSGRIEALKQIGGLKGAGDAGLLDRYVSNESTFSKMDPQQKALALERARSEEARKSDNLGSVDDPNSIAGRLQARGLAKGEARQQRMNARASGGGGGSQEDMILQMAMNGNPAALQLAGMMAQGNRETAVEDRRGRNAMQLGELNSNTAKYGYDAQKESSLASNKSNETIQGMRDESAQLDRVAELAKNQGNNELLVAVQKSKDDLAVKLAELQNSTALDIAGIEERDRQRNYELEKSDSEYSRTPEGQFGMGVRAGTVIPKDPSRSQGVAEDIALAPKYHGVVTGDEAAEIDEIALKGEPKDIVAYGRAKGWDDNKINRVLLFATGDNRINTEHTSSWGNPYAFGNKMTNPDTGVVEGDWDRWKRRFGF